MEIYAEGATFRAEFVDLGEGYSGDYDPDNPGDEQLLRLDISVHEDHALAEEDHDPVDGWVPMQKGSYCTLMRADTPAEEQQRVLNEAVRYLEKYGTLYGPIHVARKLSWIYEGYTQQQFDKLFADLLPQGT